MARAREKNDKLGKDVQKEKEDKALEEFANNFLRTEHLYYP